MFCVVDLGGQGVGFKAKTFCFRDQGSGFWIWAFVFCVVGLGSWTDAEPQGGGL